MNVLGIETATSVCSAAIVRDGELVSERTLEEKNVHSEKIITLIDEAMSAAGFTITAIDGIAVSIGPGSFTGLRIGLSVAKGLAYSLGKPLVAVPTLRALAQRAVDTGDARSGARVLSVLDARRDDVYCQCFSVSGSQAIPLWAERDMTVSGLLDLIDSMTVMITGNARGKIAAGLLARQAGTDGHVAFAADPTSKCSADSVARLGSLLLAEGKYEDATTLEPLYIKEFYLKQPSTVHNP